jgi:hypothetical protein
MPRLSQAPKHVLERDLPEEDKQQLAFDFLREHPSHKPSTIARIWKLDNPRTLAKRWRREKQRRERINKGEKIQRGGQNKILDIAQEKALLRYAAGHALNGGRGATKQMLYNCAMWLRSS